jgi:hypothetical protein
MSNTQFFVGLDLGQAKDYTAISVIERLQPARHPAPEGISHGPQIDPAEKVRFECRHLERVPLGTLYPAIVDKMGTMMDAPQIKGKSQLVVDATGVGRPVVDMLCAAGLDPVAVLITGGDAVSYDGIFTRVPKRELVSILQVMMQDKITPDLTRLAFGADIPYIETLTAEMMAFQAKINTHAHDSYGAWREGAHDDLVLAVALAVWQANRSRDFWYSIAPPRSQNWRY